MVFFALVPVILFCFPLFCGDSAPDKEQAAGQEAVSADTRIEAKGNPVPKKEEPSYRIELFPANFEGGNVSFCENLPGLLEIVSSGKGDYSGKTARMYLDLPEFITLTGVCEKYTLIRDGKPQRIPGEVREEKIHRDGQPYTRYEITFNREFLTWINASWYRHIIFLEQEAGSAGKQGNIFFSFLIGDEKQPEQSVTVRILDSVRLPERPCEKFSLWLDGSVTVDSPFPNSGAKSLDFWRSLAQHRFRNARRYRDRFIEYPGFVSMVTANGTNFLSNQDYDPQLPKDFYERMPKDVMENGKINPRRYSCVWALVDDQEGLYDRYLRTTLRKLKKIYPDIQHLWWDFEPFVCGYDEGGRARFAEKTGLKEVPTIEEIRKNHSGEYFQYMVELHAELIAKNARILREELPGVKFWLCSDNLHAAEPHVARWCGIDVSLSDEVVDYHMHMPYYTGSRYFDDTAYNVEKLKKPYFPLIDPAERIQSFYRQYSAPKIQQNILATAALGGIGIGFYPDDLLPGEYCHAIAEGFSKVSEAEDYYFDGDRCDKEFTVHAKNATVKELPGGSVITFPDFSRTIRYTAHRKDGKYLITVFNYNSKDDLIAEVSGPGFGPVLVKIPPDGVEFAGTDFIPEQAPLQAETAGFAGGGSDIFRDVRQDRAGAVWSTDQQGRPLLVISDGILSAGVDALGSFEAVSLTSSANADLLAKGFAGRISFADRLQPPLSFRHAGHGITADGCPFVEAEAEVAPYEGANPEPNPLYRLKIKRRFEIRDGKLVILHNFANPTDHDMPLNVRLGNFPRPGQRFQAAHLLLAGKYDELHTEDLWIRKPEWTNVPFGLIAEKDKLREGIRFEPDAKFDGLYSWSLVGTSPGKTAEFLIVTVLPAGQSVEYRYTMELVK